MQQPFTELDLGQHTLILLRNGGLELADSADPISCGISLNQDETYRLFICLQAQFQPATPEKEAEPWA